MSTVGIIGGSGIYNIESVTVFLISHNLELLEKCDHIFQLENGLLS